VHSRTVQDILANVLDEPEVGFYFSHGNPIPDCHNIIVEEALKDKPDYLWLVEDDNQYPPGILKALFDAHTDVAVADYPVRGNQHSVTYNAAGELLYAGLGCVLVKREVFKKLDQPYFSVERSYTPDMEAVAPMGNHGLSDVDWWARVLKLPITHKVIDMAAGHYFLEKPRLPKWGNDTAFDYQVKTWRFA
jgi:hypothetical protein